MGPHAKRSAREWFDAAARYYLEGHQACAWCGGQYRVFKAQRGGQLEYYCKDCDFYVAHDPRTGTYSAEAGRENVLDGSPALTDSLLSVRSCLGIS